MIYQPVKDKYIKYVYKCKNNREVEFSSKYMAKIIDYGISFYNRDVKNNSKNTFEEIKKKPNCSNIVEIPTIDDKIPTTKVTVTDIGFSSLVPSPIFVAHHVNSKISNMSSDLLLLKDIRDGKKEYDTLFDPDIKNFLTRVHFSNEKVNEMDVMGTPEFKKTWFGNSNKICTVTDAFDQLVTLITGLKKKYEEGYVKTCSDGCFGVLKVDGVNDFTFTIQ
jgi:hypothetical protein